MENERSTDKGVTDLQDVGVEIGTLVREHSLKEVESDDSLPGTYGEGQGVPGRGGAPSF